MPERNPLRMLAVRCAPLAILALLATTPAAAAQVPQDDAIACLIPQLGDGQGKPADSKAAAIDPKVAEAQKAKHKWWRSDEMRAEFGITDAQSIEIEKIFQSFYAALKSGMADVDGYQQKVSKMLADASASEVDVIQAIDRLEGAKAGLGRTRNLMLYRMYRVLTPEQRAKVKKFQEQKDAAASAPH
jgi:Spy/CpxP family protein refolding chaperone